MENRPEGDRRRVRLLVVATGLAAAVGLVVTAVLLGPAIRTETVPVPDLVGMTRDEAERRAGKDFDIGAGGSEASGEPGDIIISQDPTPGSQVRQGSEISVVTSAGQPPNPGDVFRDDFSDTAGGWDRGRAGDGATFDYADGGYRIFAPPERLVRIAADTARVGGDVIVEVDATRAADASGGLSGWGIECRRNGDNGYRMGLKANGGAVILKGREDATGPTDGLLAEELRNEAIREGTEVNHIRAECVGSRLTLYVNGQKALEAHDEEFGSGQVGLFVGSTELPGNTVLFDNFLVDTP